MEYSEETEYLCVDDFMRGVVEARALQTAFETGLVDYLIEDGPGTQAEVERRIGVDAAGARMLLGLLRSNGVIQERGGRIGLAAPFVKALRYRDLLQTKLEFTQLLLPDFTDLFTALIAEPARFYRASRTFDLFSYSRALEYSPENDEMTRRWVRFTTCLTRYEAASCVNHYDFSKHRRMLDIGGNSGEFALQVCRRHTAMRASVLDLPLVCDIGREHVAGASEAERIDFIRGDALAGPLPGGFDLISFKSMLHDWPEKEASLLVAKASRALEPGGTLLIFERGRAAGLVQTDYCAVPMLLFFRYFRDAEFYERLLSGLGLVDVLTREIRLDVPFCLITAKKGAEGR